MRTRLAWLALLVIGLLGVLSPAAAQPPLELPRVQLPRTLALQKLQTDSVRTLTTHLTGLGFKGEDVDSDRYVGKDSQGEYEIDVVERRMTKGQLKASVTLVEIKRAGKVERYEVASSEDTRYKVQLNGQVRAAAVPQSVGVHTNIPCLKPLFEGGLADRCKTCSTRLVPCFQLKNLSDAIRCIMRGATPCAQCGWDVTTTVGCAIGLFLLVAG